VKANERRAGLQTEWRESLDSRPRAFLSRPPNMNAQGYQDYEGIGREKESISEQWRSLRTIEVPN
jgi:hypothetical protein